MRSTLTDEQVKTVMKLKDTTSAAEISRRIGAPAHKIRYFLWKSNPPRKRLMNKGPRIITSKSKPQKEVITLTVNGFDVKGKVKHFAALLSK